LEVYVLQTALNSLIENDELISINLLENPEGKTVELNKGAEIQTIKNAGQIATQESVNVTTFENTGTIFVNAGILTIFSGVFCLFYQIEINLISVKGLASSENLCIK
jgi:hypothetical protein